MRERGSEQAQNKQRVKKIKPCDLLWIPLGGKFTIPEEDTQCNCYMNVAEVEFASTPATLCAILHTTIIAKVDTWCNSAIVRNIALCVWSFSFYLIMRFQGSMECFIK